jgi:hypothetical protein
MPSIFPTVFFYEAIFSSALAGAVGHFAQFRRFFPVLSPDPAT